MDINQILGKASKMKIAVIGDLIHDHYIYGKIERLSPEAPVPIVIPIEEKTSLGGAGNVFMNLYNLGVGVELYCNSIGLPFGEVDTDAIHNNPYPGSTKTRIVVDGQQLLRIDHETAQDQIEWLPFKKFEWWETLQEKFGQYDCIVLADYSKGVLSDSLINAIVELATHYKIPVVVDAKKDFHRFRGVDMVKCNEKESIIKNRHGIHLNKRIFCEYYKIEHFVVTRGANGMTLYSPYKDGTKIPGIQINQVDVCGAGDTVTAILAIMHCTDESVFDYCQFANLAAAEVCKHSGVYAIKKEDIQHMIISKVEYEE